MSRPGSLRIPSRVLNRSGDFACSAATTAPRRSRLGTQGAFVRAFAERRALAQPSQLTTISGDFAPFLTSKRFGINLAIGKTTCSEDLPSFQAVRFLAFC